MTSLTLYRFIYELLFDAAKIVHFLSFGNFSAKIYVKKYAITRKTARADL